MWIGTNNHIMTRYYFLEWFLAIFNPTPTWPNFTFGKLFMWIETHKDKIGLPRWVILSNVRTHSNLTELHFWSTFHVNLKECNNVLLWTVEKSGLNISPSAQDTNLANWYHLGGKDLLCFLVRYTSLKLENTWWTSLSPANRFRN